MNSMRILKLSIGLGVLAAAFSATATTSRAAEVGGLQPLQEVKIAHCCHSHSYSPYTSDCCHEPTNTVYVAPRYGAGPASVRGTARRTSRRTSRRVSRRR